MTCLKAQDVYTASSTENGKASVYKNGQLLYQISDVNESYVSSVVVDRNTDDVYFISRNLHGCAVHKNNDESGYLTSMDGSVFNALGLGDNGLYTVGYSYTNDAAAVWLNDNSEPVFNLELEGYKTKALGIHVERGGNVYTCGYIFDELADEYFGVVWKDSLANPIVAVENAWIRDVTYNDGHVYSIALKGVSGNNSSLVVYEDNFPLYILTENTSSFLLSPTWYNTLDIEVDAGNLYVSGLRDAEHGCVWKNGQVLYEFDNLDFSPLTVTSDGVYYIQNVDNLDYVYKNGQQLFQLNSYTTGCPQSVKERDQKYVSEQDCDIIPYNDFMSIGGRILKIYNPYKENRQHQYTGQLHCHSWTKYSDQTLHPGEYPYLYSMEYTESLNEEARQELIEQVNAEFVNTHKNNGYDFMVISNYSAFEDVTHEPANVPADFLWLCDSYESVTVTPVGEEYALQHIIVHSAPDFSVPYCSGTFQEIMDLVQGSGCIVQWPHPTDVNTYASPEVISTVKKNLRFMEVYDGISVRKYSYRGGQTIMTNREAVKAGVMLDDPYDDLITQGNFTFCVAISDERPAQGREPENKPEGWNPANNPMISPNHPMNIKNGCVKVFANELTSEAVFSSMMCGNFYASSNSDININSVMIENGQYIIDVGMEDVYVEFLKEDNTILDTVITTLGNTIVSYDIVGDEKFVRARLYKLNDLTYDADYWYKNKEWMIWTQPMFISPATVITYDLFVDESCTDDIPRSLPFIENFDMGTTDWNCWTKTDEGVNWNNDDHDHTCASYWHRIVYDESDSDNYCARHKSNSSFTQEGWLISPRIFLQPGRDIIAMTFRTLEEYSDDYGYEGVWISTSANTPDVFTEIWSQTNPSDSWQLVNIDLSEYQGQDVYMAFKYVGENGHSWYIDDITITNTIQYSIEVIANNPEWGTVTGGAVCEQDDEITITATPNTGYDFLKWIKDGTEVSTNASYSFTVTENATYTAVFCEHEEIYYTIATTVSPEDAGIVEGGDTYPEGAIVTLEVSASFEWQFSQWQDGNTDNPRTIIVTSDAIYTALFTQINCDIKVSASSAENIILYPNPTNDIIRIDGICENVEVRIYNTIGELVKMVNVGKGDEIRVNDLRSGFYIVRFGENTLGFAKE